MRSSTCLCCMCSQLAYSLAPAGVSVLQVEFEDLEMHRIIGTGQFGLVRIVRHMKTNEVYALKVGTVDVKMCLLSPEEWPRVSAGARKVAVAPSREARPLCLIGCAERPLTWSPA